MNNVCHPAAHNCPELWPPPEPPTEGETSECINKIVHEPTVADALQKDQLKCMDQTESDVPHPTNVESTQSNANQNGKSEHYQETTLPKHTRSGMTHSQTDINHTGTADTSKFKKGSDADSFSEYIRVKGEGNQEPQGAGVSKESTEQEQHVAQNGNSQESTNQTTEGLMINGE